MFDATPLFRVFVRHRLRQLGQQQAATEQARLLLQLVAQAQNTRFGNDHDFATIRSVDDFQSRVPLRSYEDMWRDYWQGGFPTLRDVSWPGLVPAYAVTSGTTTGATKYIPCTAAMNRSNRKAALDVLVHHIANRPNSRVLGGRSFMLGGSTDLVDEAPGVVSGDLSGIAAATVPWWARAYAFPPPTLALIADWDQKIEQLARSSLAEDIRSISGTPSWLLLFFEKLAALAGKPDAPLSDLYPNLDLLVHGGVNFTPYQHRFDGLLAGSHAELREVYPASEGFIAVADRGSGDGLRLITDNGLFYEFVPLDELGAANPTRHWLGTAEIDVNYALVLSSCAGLWSYIIGDTVRLIERDLPRLLVTGRTSYMLSAFGEHLIGSEIDDAIADAASSIHREVTDYAVGALFPDHNQSIGGHQYIVEFSARDGQLPDVDAFAQRLDTHLCQTNDDYKAHRADGFGLRAPAVHPVPAGTFAAWMKKRGKLGGQNKVPRIINDQDLLSDLRRFTGADQSVS